MPAAHERPHLRFVFVHGTGGWGSLDERYARLPYWGMRTGDLMAHLQGLGYACHAASVSPHGSAWDRACELYAQLFGVRVDYGASHAARHRHERFGRDYSSEGPVLTDDDCRLVLIGHSFGGTTARLLAELMANGSEDERQAAGSDATSPLFLGGMRQRVLAVLCLATPLNGNATFDMLKDRSFDLARVKVPWWSRPLGRRMAKVLDARGVGDATDAGDFDMHIDRAQAMNRELRPLPDVYYLSVPCSLTRRSGDVWVPKRGMEPFFVERSCQLGAYEGTTPEGVSIDTSWRENDGRVSTMSERAPFGDPQTKLDPHDVVPGVWNVFPTHNGDHMSLMGGLLHRHEVRPFYEDLLALTSSLA